MSQEKVDQAQLMRYIELEKEIQGLEAQNALKTYEVRNAAAKDVKETIENVEMTLQALIQSTEREKADVDRMLNGSIKDAFSKKDKKKLTKEQEEYLEAKNKEEVARQQLSDLKKQLKELEDRANEVKAAAEKQKVLYEERDDLLSAIFGGEYGSETENMLEAQYDSLIDRKQRVSVANHKWNAGRVLLGEASKQMAYATKKWVELKNVIQMQIKYQVATEVRNNLVAALQNNNNTQSYLSNIKFPYCDKSEMQTLERAINNIYADIKYYMVTEARNNNIAAMANIDSTAKYLGEKIKFPYCYPEEMAVFKKATDNIYLDMADPNRHDHALKCYDTTYKREGALIQWFDNVINETISKDLEKVTKEAREVEKKLRAERIRLIREKIAESGGDVSAISDAGLKGMTDQTKLSDADMDMKGIGITRPARVGGDHGIPDAQQQMDDDMITAPTPIPLSALSAKPTEEDLFGDISELKEEYKKNTEEYNKTQEMNKARMEQGLQQKLAQRRHRKK